MLPLPQFDLSFRRDTVIVTKQLVSLTRPESWKRNFEEVDDLSFYLKRLCKDP